MRAANVKDGQLAMSDVLTMNFDPIEQATFGLRHGDVLVTEGCGSIGELGASARWSNEMRDPVCFQNTLLRLRARPGMARPEFIEQWSRWAHKSGIWAGVAGGTNIFHIGLKRAKEIPILLPPLPEQRRIVDLIAAVDAAIEATERNRERSTGLLGAALTEWNQAWAGPTMRLGDLAEVGSGPSWSSKEEHAEEVVGGTRVLGITNTPSSGDVDLSHVKYVTGLPPSSRRLGAGSLLMIRTNGNRSRIGNVYRVPAEANGAAFSAFQIGITFGDAADADFAYWVLVEPSLQQRISNEASGSTGLGNVAVKWLRQLQVPWPDGNERRSTSALFEAIATHSRQCKKVLTRLRHLRSTLLSDLLSGDHEIPDSYDELLSA